MLFLFVRSSDFNKIRFTLISIYITLFFIYLFINPYYNTFNLPAVCTNVLFTVLFAIEIGLRIFAFSLIEFWQDYSNRFNVFCVIVSMPAYIAYIQSPHNLYVIRYYIAVQILVLLRFFEVVMYFERLRAVLESLRSVLPALAMFGVIIACIYYEYAIIGMWLFGAKIDSGNVDPRINPVFTQYLYHYSNFNDVIDAYIVLFALMIVNNWNAIMDGYVDITSKWVRLYFMSFYLVTVMIALNLSIPTFLRFLLKEFDVRETEKRRPSLSSDDVHKNGQDPAFTGIHSKKYSRGYQIKVFSNIVSAEPTKVNNTDSDHVFVMRESNIQDILEGVAAK